MFLEFLILTIILILNIIILFGILNVRIKKNRTQRYLFIGIIIGIILWVLTIFVTDIFYKNKLISLWFSRLSFTSTAFLSIFYILFANSFHKSFTKLEKLTVKVLIIISIIAMFTSLSDYIVEETKVIGEFNLKSTFGNLYYVFAIYVSIVFAYPSFLLYRAYKKEKSITLRMQILYIFVGSVLSILFSFFTNLILPILGFGEIRYLGPLCLVFFLGFTYYSILRYRFLSIRYISGKLAYFILLSIFIFVSFYGIYLFQLLLWDNIFAPGALISGGFIAVIYVLVFKKCDQKIKEFLEKMLIFSEYDPFETINRLLKITSTELRLEKVVVNVLSLTRSTFKCNKVSLILFDKENRKVLYKKFIGFNKKGHRNIRDLLEVVNYWDLQEQRGGKSEILVLDELLQIKEVEGDRSDRLLKIMEFMKDEKVAVLLPLNRKVQLNGLLLIGNKGSEDAFTVQDIDLLEGIVANASVAVGRAFLYDQVEKSADILEYKVEEATKKLREKIHALEEARRKEKDMIDILGHELRTPMSIIKSGLGYVSMLYESKIKRKIDKKAQDKINLYYDRINENIEREIQLINTLLTSTKIDKDEVNLDMQKVDIFDVVEDGIVGQRKQANKRKLYIRFRKPKNWRSYPGVYADRARIQEVIDNLLSNAVKYTDKGGVDVELNKNDKSITIKVKDTGIGIPKEEIKNLGKKFYRIKQYTEGSKERNMKMVRAGGSGLGLYVTFGLVKAHGGEINVKSKINKGTIFSFTLPIYKDQPIDEKEEENNEKNVFKRKKMK